jgi:microsomal dipeptidase-like Zn-dependent dipeptidase
MEIVELHNDALLELPDDELLPYLTRIKADGVREILLSIWTTELSDPMGVIAGKKPLLQNADPAKIPRIRLHIEDAWFLTPENIDGFIALRPFSVGLTWNHKNAIAGGADSNGGITKWGREVIKKLESAGIQIDTAHLNRRSFGQFTKITARPILCTHTACDAVHRHRRNLTDRQIKTIIASKGLIGVCFVPKFLGGDVAEHIVHLLSFPGAERHIAIGTDFYGTAELPAELKDYKDFAGLKRILKRRGIDGETIGRILHTNVYEFSRNCRKIKPDTAHPSR